MSIDRRVTLYLTLVVCVFWGAIPYTVNANEKSAMYQMAEIMHRLKHFPSPRGKETLNQIISSKTVSSNERILAVAMLNLDHEVIVADINNLKSIVNDKNASEDEKALATILLNFSHRTSNEEKERLKAMMK